MGEVKAALAALDRLELLVRRRGGSVMLEELWRQLEGAAGASPGVDGAAASAVGGGGGRSSTPGDIITIDSDAESSKSSTWTPSPRVADVGSRRKSRLAANFSGNEQ